MISSEVQRTLVKSPPELWAELSDPAALARHLGELGEIRIVRTEPESTVEWAAENTTGTVSIKPSGWGTKVTLSVTRETPGAQPAVAEPADESPAALEPPAAPELAPEPEPEPEPVAAVEPSPAEALEPEPVPDPEPEPAAEVATEPATTVEPEPRRGFFARLFGRRSAPRAVAAPEPAAVEAEAPEAAAAEQPDAFTAVREALAPEAFASSHVFAAAPPERDAREAPLEQEASGGQEAPGEPSWDISAELMAAEGVAAEQVSAEEVTAVLTAVLDRLGAAHHRPFSRA